MVTTIEKQKMLQQINQMSMEDLLELSEHTLRALQNIHKSGIPKEQQSDSKTEEINLYSLFEKEFGRPLSAFEIESLNMWIDQDNHAPNIIKAALKEAVVARKLNLRYVDRILFDWKKNGIKTPEEAKEYSINFRGSRYVHKTKPAEKNSRPSEPLFSWLEN